MTKICTVRVRPLIAACALAVSVVTLEVQAANWVMIQGAENPNTPAFKYFGVAALTYGNNYGCEPLAGLRNPATGSTTTNLGLNNGSTVNNCRVGPELRNKESDLYLDTMVLGARGNLIPEHMNYFVAINGGANGTTYKPFKTERERLVSLTDATMTFSYIPGARARIGLMRKPGPEEQYQGADAQDYIFSTDFIARVQNERFTEGNTKGAAAIPGQGYAGNRTTYGYDQDAGRDWGIMFFDAFKGEKWTTTYAVMFGNGNGIHQGDNNSAKDLNLYLSSEYDLPGGKGQLKHGVKTFGYYQQGVRNFVIDPSGTLSEDFDRIRYGVGFKALGGIFGENNGRHRLGAELMFADGMIHVSPTGNVADSAFPSYMQFAAERGNKARGITLDYGYYLNKNWQFDIRYSRNDLLYETVNNANWKPSDERILQFVDLGVNYHFTPHTRMTVNYVFRNVTAPTPVAGTTTSAQIQTENQNILTGAVGNGFGLRLSHTF